MQKLKNFKIEKVIKNLENLKYYKFYKDCNKIYKSIVLNIKFIIKL